jgi:hypothetical protein
MNRAHHLQDERLFDCYLAVRSGESLDPPVVEHLTDCDACGERYAELTRSMDTLSVDAAAEADAIFTPERLRAQQQQIGRRIEHLGQPARVITFPGRAGSHHTGASAPRSVRRWIAAAAAAGLFIGVGTGLLLDWEAARGGSVRTKTLARQAVLKPPAAAVETVRPDISEFYDQEFLSDLELAGDRPRTRELLAFDALTPHVREITLR